MPTAEWGRPPAARSDFYHAHSDAGDWQILARWIDETLPYSSLWFYPLLWAVNVSWHEKPQRRIDSYAVPKGRWALI